MENWLWLLQTRFMERRTRSQATEYRVPFWWLQIQEPMYHLTLNSCHISHLYQALTSYPYIIDRRQPN